ncbi:triose-phosphate isomerase [Haloechinothrix sp. LS1_15]|uniref:triose-phosphate isomerase n=1 Tax=Haloechinothrix sp. LS1_15 TaxID=2652248 RepID=UPI0029450F3A|nr:triose-phosphate isomerase [Haloechinothrix sp. LS1_15]MDV6013239.1 triose-phosphate isomerase [Haloechinothrix sp. LS1_15]
MTTKPLIAGNWKMNLNHLEAIALVQKIAFTLPKKYLENVDVAVLPPFTDIRSVQTLIEGDKLAILHGAQDVSAHESGAYTGEVSAAMLAKLGCTYVVVGHSERREHHGESDDLINAKVRIALKHGLTPILCVGEPLEVREDGRQLDHTTEQLSAALRRVSAEQAGQCVIAYEPVWAIGTGRVATPADAEEVCAALRDTLTTKYGEETSAGIRILYGGSVKSSNIADLVQQPNINGALVGGASLDADEFTKLCAMAAGGPLP